MQSSHALLHDQRFCPPSSKAKALSRMRGTDIAFIIKAILSFVAWLLLLAGAHAPLPVSRATHYVLAHSGCRPVAGSATLGTSCSPLCRYFLGGPALVICWEALVLLLCIAVQARHLH